jgi:putative endonuclease
MHDEKRGYVYIITNRPCGVLYTGVTSQLVQRIYQHKHKLVEGFSKRYNLDKIVYYEMFDLVTDAIAREKQIKKFDRRTKFNLIERMNPDWNDLFETLV